MSNYQPLTPDRAPKPPLHKRKAIVLPIAGAFLFLTGMGIGDATDPAAQTIVKEVPGPVTIKEVPGETIETVKEVKGETVTVKVTPQGCLDMIDYFGEMLTVTSGYIDLIPKAADAGMSYDVAAAEAVSAEMEDLAADTEALTGPVTTATAECRGASS